MSCETGKIQACMNGKHFNEHLQTLESTMGSTLQTFNSGTATLQELSQAQGTIVDLLQKMMKNIEASHCRLSRNANNMCAQTVFDYLNSCQWDMQSLESFVDWYDYSGFQAVSIVMQGGNPGVMLGNLIQLC
mmetsp:Transcript_60838/g.131786  ORF Transcript_60838/g.131786 Transcript_60838/m.131786 type:complete len:132 (-) Transcript_60838:88-483(-)